MNEEKMEAQKTYKGRSREITIQKEGQEEGQVWNQNKLSVQLRIMKREKGIHMIDTINQRKLEILIVKCELMMKLKGLNKKKWG